MNDLEWLLKTVDVAIARFNTEGVLVQYNVALAQCWSKITCLPQHPHYQLIIQELLEQGYGSVDQCQRLKDYGETLPLPTQSAATEVIFTPDDSPTQHIYLRRTADGGMLWVIKVETADPALPSTDPQPKATSSPIPKDHALPSPNWDWQKKPAYSQPFLQAILTAIPAPLFVKNEQHQHILFNPAFEQLFGKTTKQLLGKTDHEFMPTVHADKCQEQDKLAFQSRYPVQNDEEVVLYGQARLFHLIKQSFQVGDGQKFIVGIARDVTRQRQAENALRASEETNRALILAIPDMLMRVWRDGRMEYIKLSASVTPYLALDEPSNMTLIQTIPNVLPPQQAEQRMQAVRDALDSGCVQVYEQILEVGGRTVHEEVRVSPSGEDEVLVMVRDISDRKRAEAEVRHSLLQNQQLNYLKSRFLEMVSHEFRTPLTQVQAATDLLRYLPANDTERDEYFECIQQGIVQMTQMMNEIVHLQQTVEYAYSVNVQPVNIERLCREAIANLTQNMSRQVFLAVRQPEECYQVCTDAHALRQILRYVLTNALQYSEADTEVVVSIEITTDSLILQVTDHGIGILPEDRPYLFEYFYRGRNIGNLPGTGLGLAIAKHYINLLQGHVELIDPPHPGTCFSLCFPLTSTHSDSVTDGSIDGSKITPARS